MARRDFIISALHQIPEDTDVETSPEEVSPASLTLEGIENRAAELARGTHVAGTTVHDIGRLYRALRERVVARGMTPACAGLLVDRTLWHLPRGPAGDVSVLLVGSLRPQQLGAIGRAGILALRDAACLAPPEESEAAVRALDEELARRGPPSCRQVNGTWVIAEGAAPEALDAAHERLDRMHDRPLLSSALSGMAVVVVPAAERGIDPAVVLAHVRAFARREFDRGLCAALSDLQAHDVTALDEERILADAVDQRPWLRRANAARSALRGVVARLRVTPEPAFLSH